LRGPGVRTCRAHPPVLAVRLRVGPEFFRLSGLHHRSGPDEPAPLSAGCDPLLFCPVLCQCRSQVAEGEFGRDVLAALGTIGCVAPRSQKSGTIFCQQDRKVFSLRINFETEICAPIGGDLLRSGFEALQDSPEPHPIRIEEPGAVAGLEHKRFHILNSGRCTFQLPRNGVATL